MLTCRHVVSVAMIVVAAAVGMVAYAEAFVRTPLPANHPLVGHWRIDLPHVACAEEYQVRPDGTRSISAGDERAESEFMIALRPDPKGFYSWTDRIVASNGKADCTGSVAPVGRTAGNFILVHPDGNHFLVCKQAEIQSCFGPYVRIRANDP